MEKQLLEKKLKEEAEKNREMLSAKLREMSKMRKKQEKTAEIARKLAKNDKTGYNAGSADVHASLQELNSSQSINSLKKSASMYKMSESQQNLSRTHGTASRGGRTRSLSPDSMALLFQTSTNSLPDIQDKKSSIEKELWMCQNAKKISFAVRDLEGTKERLMSEQRELLVEREKCVEMDADETGFMDPNKPQYMDDRLTVIADELDVLDMRLDEFRMQTLQVTEQQLQEYGIEGRSEVNLEDGQIAWNNVASMLSSLRSEEILVLIQEYLDELMNARVYQEDLTSKISEKEKIVIELRAALDLMRNAAMEAAMDAERRLSEAQQYSRRLLMLVKDCYEGERSFPENMDAFIFELSDSNVNADEDDASILENQQASLAPAGFGKPPITMTFNRPPSPQLETMPPSQIPISEQQKLSERQLSQDPVVVSAIPIAAESEESRYERDRFEIYEPLKEEKSARRSSFDRLIKIGSNAISKFRKKHEKSSLSRSVSSIYPEDTEEVNSSNHLDSEIIPEDLVGAVQDLEFSDQYSQGSPGASDSGLLASSTGKLTFERGLLKKVNMEQNEKKKQKSQMNLKAAAAAAHQAGIASKGMTNVGLGSDGNVFSRLHQSHTISSDRKRK